jgi:hypothetical protein
VIDTEMADSEGVSRPLVCTSQRVVAVAVAVAVAVVVAVAVAFGTAPAPLRDDGTRTMDSSASLAEQ